MNEIMNILIGERQFEYINLEIEGKLYPEALDYWDGNYLKTVVKLEIPGFRGSFSSNIRTFELKNFLEGLVNINKSVGFECFLSNVDENITVIGKASYTGTIDWDCTIIYPAGDGARLMFDINTSSSLVNELILAIERVLETWPIIDEK